MTNSYAERRSPPDPERHAGRALDDVIDRHLEDTGRLKQALYEMLGDDQDAALELICDAVRRREDGDDIRDVLRPLLNKHLMDSSAHLSRINELEEDAAEDRL